MEYEAQTKAVSQRAISTLLDRIASDENMTDKERKQKLKLVGLYAGMRAFCRSELIPTL